MSATPVAFPYMPDGDPDRVESLEYSTDILTAYRQKEQRIARRTLPGGRIEMTLRALDPAETTELLGLLYAHQEDEWYVPLWPFALPTSAALTGGETFLPIAAPVAGYGLEVIPWQEDPVQTDPQVLLYRNDSQYQLLGFAGIAYDGGWGAAWGDDWGAATPSSPSGINVSNAVQGDGTGWGVAWGLDWGGAEPGTTLWPAGSKVIPVRRARLDPDTASALESLQAISAPLRFVIEEAA